MKCDSFESSVEPALIDLERISRCTLAAITGGSYYLRSVAPSGCNGVRVCDKERWIVSELHGYLSFALLSSGLFYLLMLDYADSRAHFSSSADKSALQI